MNPSIDSASAKLDGAEERLGKIKEMRDRRAVTDLLTMRTDRDRKGRVRVRVKELAQVPQEWHVWIGECVHDVRSALDHVAYALNIVGSGADPPPNEARSQFPLYTRGAKYRAMARAPRENCMIGYFPRGARTRVEAIQPYHHRRHQLIPLWLRVLVQLSNIDKHRRFPVSAVMPSFKTFPRRVEGHRVTWGKSGPYRALKAGATFMWLEVPALPASAQQPNVEYSYAAGFNFVGKAANPPLPLVMDQEPVDFVLGMIIKTVRELVFPIFEPFLEG